MPQASVRTGETCTGRAGGVPGAVGLASGGQEEALEQQDWHLGAGGAPATGIGSTALGLLWPILGGQRCPLELPAEKTLFLEWEQGVPHKGLLMVGRS